MKEENKDVINSNNKVYDYLKYIECKNMINDISENIYPVMYIDNKPVYEGDKLLFRNENEQQIREIKWQHRLIVHSNKKWIKLWSFSVN